MLDVLYHISFFALYGWIFLPCLTFHLDFLETNIVLLALHIHMSKYAFAALEMLEGYEIRPRGEMQIKVRKIP